MTPLPTENPPARSPLGRLFRGECRALPYVHKTEAECCNFGYARGLCPHFPDEAEADCVRLNIGASENVIWVLEKNYAPLRSGSLQTATPLIRQQAAVLLESLG